MGGDSPGTDDQYWMMYQAAYDAIFSVAETVLCGVVLSLIGIFGLGMVYLTATVFINGTATQGTFFAGLFGISTAVFAGYELYHL